MHVDVVIVGAGISGLVTAHRLRRAGHSVLLLEKSNRAGGVIETVNVDGYRIEKGPNSIRGTRELLRLVDDLGLRSTLVTGDPRLPAYTFSRGELRPVPMSPPQALTTSTLSLRGKLRLLYEPFVTQRMNTDEESVSAFVRRRLGNEVFAELVAPFVSGIYAGDAERLSVQACFGRLADFEKNSGSITQGVFSALRKNRKERTAEVQESLRPYRLCSFQNGLSTLTGAIAKQLGESIVFETRIDSLAVDRANGGHRYGLRVMHGQGSMLISTRAIVMATPSQTTGEILKDLAPELATLLTKVRYNSLASVPLGLHTNELPQALKGFGFLATRQAGLRILGSIWNSAAFSERAPEGFFLVTSFIGGTNDPTAVDLPDAELTRTVLNDLETVFKTKLDAKPLPITRYRSAIPQYEIGHLRLKAAIEARVKEVSGLWLVGNYLGGVSVGDCVANSREVAAQVEMNLHQGHTSD